MSSSNLISNIPVVLCLSLFEPKKTPPLVTCWIQRKVVFFPRSFSPMLFFSIWSINHFSAELLVTLVDSLTESCTSTNESIRTKS